MSFVEFFVYMIQQPQSSKRKGSSAASNVYKRQLEMWYRQHDNGSAEHQTVRATIASSKEDRINAASSFRVAAMKVRDDFERSALLLRKSLIEFAHAGGWKEAVNLIDNHPELTASVTLRFQLYLRTCADAVNGRN